MKTRYEEVHNQHRGRQHSWLMTGAAGFIGSNLVEKLLCLSLRFVGLDDFETG